MNHSKPKGFTILEVIIVLVIGAIIMIAVFLVVPQLQREQRNRRRQSDARNILQAAEQVYATKGAYPGSSSTVSALKCLSASGTGAVFTSGSGNCPSILSITGDIKTPANANYSNVDYIPNTASRISVTYDKHRCDSNISVTTNVTGEKNFVVMVPQETSSTSFGVFCLSAKAS